MEPMTQAKWSSMSEVQKAAVRDLSGLTYQLIGLEGYRVQVVDTDGTKRRFIVGKSTGWRPCHLEIKTCRSLGGDPARTEYATVRRLHRVR